MKRLFVIVLATLLAACSSQDAPSPLTVNTAGNHYHNAFFGVSVDKPDGWYSQSPEETIALQQRGTTAISGKDQNMKAMIEASLKSSVPVFGFFQLPPGTPGKSNPNVLSVAENLQGFPGVKTGCDYLYFVRQLLEKGKLAYSFTADCAPRTFAGESFGYMEGQITFGEKTVTQRYYATIRGQYALSFIQTYFSDEGEAATGTILNSVKLEPVRDGN